MEVNMKKVYQHFKNKNKRSILKRTLTEMSQKLTLECTKKESNLFKRNGQYFCPCKHHVGNKFFTTNSKNKKVKIILNRCHVKTKRSDIINKVLNENPCEKDICVLLDRVLQEHFKVKVIFACQTCNKKLE